MRIGAASINSTLITRRAVAAKAEAATQPAVQRATAEQAGKPAAVAAKTRGALTPNFLAAVDVAAIRSAAAEKTAPHAAEAITTPRTIGATDQQPTIRGLLAAWGQNDAMYDLDGNGTVNASDLARLLGSLTPTPTQETKEETRPAEDAAAPAATTELETPAEASVAVESAQPETPLSPIDALLAEWGEGESKYDLNGDARVNAADLAILLGSLSPQPEQKADAAKRTPADPVVKTEEAAASNARSRVQLESIADRLAHRVGKSPADSPRTLVHEALSKIDLSSAQREFLLARLSAQFPRGLDIDQRA